MPKDKNMQVLVTEDTQKDLKKEATALGVSVSAYIRNIIQSRQDTPIYKVASTMCDKGGK